MNPPIDSGGSEELSVYIRSIMPPHKVWCEPFFLEGEVFFRKRPSAKEVINDRDGRIINFYMVLKTRCEQLAFLAESTLYSDFMAQMAEAADADTAADALYRAWAFWLRYSKAFILPAKWSADDLLAVSGTGTGYADHWRHVSARLADTVITDRDPLKVMAGADGPDTLFYIRPRDRRDLTLVEAMLPSLKGRAIICFGDRRLMTALAMRQGLFTDETGRDLGVYTTFRRQGTLFDGWGTI